MWIKHASNCYKQLPGDIFYLYQKLTKGQIRFQFHYGQFSDGCETQILTRSARSCVFFVLTVFFKLSFFHSYRRSSYHTSHTHTLLQYFSLIFLDIFMASRGFRACLRRFHFSILGARRSFPTTMASFRSFSS